MTRTFNLALMTTLLALAGSAAAAPTAWISSEKDSTLTLVDLSSLKVSGSVPTCKRPRHMQMMPGGKQLVVVCSDSGQADLIDVATQKSVGRVSLGEDPEILDVSPDGKTFYVSAEDDATLNFVSSGAGKILREVKVGKEPEGVKATPDGKTVYVTSEVASLVHVIDVASGKVTKNIKVGKRPRRFALSPDGNELWVTNELGASVSVIDTRSGSVSATLNFEVKGVRKEDITPVGITFTADGKRAFVGLGRSNHVAFIDVPSRKVTALVLAGKRAWSVALNKAETQLVVVNGLSDDITVIDVAGAKALKSIAVGRVPHTAVVVE
jgi:PQQ-dependent catabolism-associated beta-propeller protein